MAFEANERHVKRISTELRERLSRKGIDRTYKHCRALANKMFAATPAAPDGCVKTFDQDLRPKIQRERWKVQAAVLVADGVGESLAENIIRDVSPTAKAESKSRPTLSIERANGLLNDLETAYAKDDLARASRVFAKATLHDLSPIVGRITEILLANAEKDPRALHHLALTHSEFEEGGVQKAISYVDRQLELFPDDPQRGWVWVLRGELHSGVKGGVRDIKAALRDYKEGAALGNPLAAMAAANLLVDMGSGEARDEARMLLAQAAKAGLPEAMTNLAIMIGEDSGPKKKAAEVSDGKREAAAEFVLKLVSWASALGDTKATDVLSQIARDKLTAEKPSPSASADVSYRTSFTPEMRMLDNASSISAAKQRLRSALMEGGHGVLPEHEARDILARLINIDRRETRDLFDEALDLPDLVERHQKQVEIFLDAYPEMSIHQAQSVLYDAALTRFSGDTPPLVVNVQDRELRYRLPKLRTDEGEIKVVSLGAGGNTLCDTIGLRTIAGLNALHRVDDDGIDVFSITDGGRVIATMYLRRQASIDPEETPDRPLCSPSFDTVLHGLVVQSLKLPILRRLQDDARQYFASVIAKVSMLDCEWIVAAGHKLGLLRTFVAGDAEDKAVFETSMNAMAIQGLALLGNRKRTDARPLEERVSLTGLDFLDLRTGTIHQQGDPADGAWWDKDGWDQ